MMFASTQYNSKKK